MWEVLRRGTIFLQVQDMNLKDEGLEETGKWSQCGGKEAWEEKETGSWWHLFDPSLQQALPHTFKLYAPMHSFWVDKSVYCLQVKESYGLNHWPQGCWKIRMHAGWHELDGLIGMRYTGHIRPLRNVLLLKLNSYVCRFFVLFSVLCMYEKSQKTKFYLNLPVSFLGTVWQYISITIHKAINQFH